MTDFYDREQSLSPNTQPDRRGMAITSMVLGILSICLMWYPFVTSIPCIILAIVAIVLSSKSKQNLDYKHHGFAKAGMITGIIGLILSTIYTIVMAVLVIGLSNGNYYSYY